MEEKKPIKISLSTFFLIIAIIVIIAMGCYIFIDKSNAKKEIENLKADINNKQVDQEILEKNNEINTINTNNITSTVTNNDSNKDDIIYEINKKDDGHATIKATKNGKTISKDIEMDAMIDKTGTIEIDNIGKVALISESGGEYCKVHIFQLVDNEIKSLGNIDCGADMVKDVTYTVNKKNEGTAVIKAKINNETVEKEFQMDAAIVNTKVIDIFNYGKVVLVAETGGEYYGIQVYRLSQDYTTGKSKEIKNVGTIQSK